MNEVGAYEMQPAGRPALGKEVIFPFVVDQAVKIVDPSFLMFYRGNPPVIPIARRDVELWSQIFVIESFVLNGLLRPIGLDDMVDIDVAPIAAFAIDDHYSCLDAAEFRDAPFIWRQCVGSMS